MKKEVDGVPIEQPLDEVAIVDGPLLDRRLAQQSTEGDLRLIPGPPHDRDDLRALLEQRANQPPSEEPCCTGDQNCFIHPEMRRMYQAILRSLSVTFVRGS